MSTSQALIAAAPYADRIELCIGLDIGGLTPDYGLMAQAAASGLETHVLIRARAGDFTMNAEDLEAACANIKVVRDLGLKGIVIGAERGGQLDLDPLRVMADAAGHLDLTLHRVIDVVDDPLSALDAAISLGFSRILTSGGAPSAPEGLTGLRQLHDAAAGRIEIMAGGGIRSANLGELIENLPVTSFHASCTASRPLAQRYQSFGFGREQRRFDEDEARAIAQILGRPIRDGRHA